MKKVTVVGGGLAGCEAAWQLATRGYQVVLHEQKPHKRTPAQNSDRLAELVCSNSLRGAALTNAVGLLKEELRRAGSLIMHAADRTRVPAGGALAVDRERFADEIEHSILNHPQIERVAGEVTSLPSRDQGPVILATGPLTGDSLARELEQITGGQLAYYDAISPIVSAESINESIVFAASRWNKGLESTDTQEDSSTLGGDQAYLNAPMNKEHYELFVDALLAAEKVNPHSFEDIKYFEGCLPIEVMAERGRETLRFGPMKPVGLTDPRTGRWPYAVVQLRQEDEGATAYNLVGFQTRMTYSSQAQVFRLIPGLEHVDFLRYGSVHRNTFVNAPKVLDSTMQLRHAPGIFLAGQITGVEGYVESAANGLTCAIVLAQRLSERTIVPPPPTTALGALLRHLSPNSSSANAFQPSNITWAMFPMLEEQSTTKRKIPKLERYQKMAERALKDIDSWLNNEL